MKPLPRNEDGSYDGAIGSESALSAQECRKVREALAQQPKYITQLARECGIDRSDPKKFDALCKYVDHLGQHTQEAEMSWIDTRRGRKFIGWVLTEHGKQMLEIS